MIIHETIGPRPYARVLAPYRGIKKADAQASTTSLLMCDICELNTLHLPLHHLHQLRQHPFYLPALHLIVVEVHIVQATFGAASTK